MLEISQCGIQASPGCSHYFLTVLLFTSFPLGGRLRTGLWSKNSRTGPFSLEPSLVGREGCGSKACVTRLKHERGGSGFSWFSMPVASVRTQMKIHVHQGDYTVFTEKDLLPAACEHMKEKSCVDILRSHLLKMN